MGTTASTVVDNFIWDVLTGPPAEVWSEDDLNGSALSFFFPGTPPQAQAIELYERGISTYRPLFVSHEGVSNRPPIRTIQEMERVKHIRKLHKLITIDMKSVKYLAISESSWQLTFAYIPSEIPCEVVLSFSAILGDNSSVANADFTTSPIYLQVQPSPSLNDISEEGHEQKHVHEVDAHHFYSEHAHVFISRRHIPSLLFNSGSTGGSTRRNGSHSSSSVSSRKSAVDNNSNLLDLCILVRPVLENKLKRNETISSSNNNNVPTKLKVDDVRPAETQQPSSSSSPTGFRRLRPGSILPIPSSMLPSNASPGSPSQPDDGTSDSPTRNPWRSLTTFSLPWQRSTANGGGGGNRILDSSLYYSALRTFGGDSHPPSSSSAHGNNTGSNNSNNHPVPKEYVASELYTFCVEPGAVQRFQHQAQYLTVHNFPPLPLLLRQYMISIQHKDEEVSLSDQEHPHQNDENRTGNNSLIAGSNARGGRGVNTPTKGTTGAKDPALAMITTYSHEVYTVKEIFNQPRALYHSPSSLSSTVPSLPQQRQTTATSGTTSTAASNDATVSSNVVSSIGVPIVVKMIPPMLAVSPAMTPQTSPQIAVRKSLQMNSRKHHPQLPAIGPDTVVLPQSAESLAEEMRAILTQQLKDKQRHKHHAERELRRQQRREQRRHGSTVVSDGAMDGNPTNNTVENRAMYGKIAEIPAFRKSRTSGSDVSQPNDVQGVVEGSVSSDIDGPNNIVGNDPSQSLMLKDNRKKKHHHNHHRSHHPHSGSKQHRRGGTDVASVGEVDEEGEEEEEEEEKDDIPDGVVTQFRTSQQKHHNANMDSNGTSGRKKMPAATDNMGTASLHNSFINSRNNEGNNEDQTSVEPFSSSQATPEDNLCVICLSTPRCIVLFPCRHCLLCWECAQTVGGLSDGNDPHHNHNNNANKNKCPMCRTLVLFLLRLPVVESAEEGNKVVNTSSNNLVTNHANDCADNTTNNTANNTDIMSGNNNNSHDNISSNNTNGTAQMQTRSPRTIIVTSSMQHEHANTAPNPTESIPVSGSELEMISRQWMGPPISHSSDSSTSSTPSASWSAAAAGATSSSFSSAASPADVIQLFRFEDPINDTDRNHNNMINNSKIGSHVEDNNTPNTTTNITNTTTNTTLNTHSSQNNLISTRPNDTNDINSAHNNHNITNSNSIHSTMKINNSSNGNSPQGIVPGVIVPAFSIAISRESSSSALSTSSPRGSMYPHVLDREDTLFDFLN